MSFEGVERVQYPDASVKRWGERRDERFRKIFALVAGDKASDLIDDTLTKEKLTTPEIDAERAGDGRKKAPLVDQLSSKKKPNVFTAGAFVIDAICKQAATAAGAAKIAAKGRTDELQNECGSLKAYFDERKSRAASSVNVEVVQHGYNRPLVDQTRKEMAEKKLGKGKPSTDSKSPGKDQDFERREKWVDDAASTCSPNNPFIVLEPYTAQQYEHVRGLYFRASLTAGYFLSITTHKETDGGNGHCDPRCFRLKTFYADTAAALGHPKGSIYGIQPHPGTEHSDNLWWSDKHCGAKE